jgi:hypothetical protein
MSDRNFERYADKLVRNRQASRFGIAQERRSVWLLGLPATRTPSWEVIQTGILERARTRFALAETTPEDDLWDLLVHEIVWVRHLDAPCPLHCIQRDVRDFIIGSQLMFWPSGKILSSHCQTHSDYHERLDCLVEKVVNRLLSQGRLMTAPSNVYAVAPTHEQWAALELAKQNIRHLLEGRVNYSPSVLRREYFARFDDDRGHLVRLFGDPRVWDDLDWHLCFDLVSERAAPEFKLRDRW